MSSSTDSDSDPNSDPDRAERRRAILQAGSWSEALERPEIARLLDDEARDPGLSDRQRLFTPDQLALARLLRDEADRARDRLGLFFSTDDVVVVPGFMGSSLRDVDGPRGLI